MIKKLLRNILPCIDIALVPLVFISAVTLRAVRRAGVGRLTFVKKTLLRVGVFPIADHYYEPMFNEKNLRQPLDADRNLPGIDLNVDEQLNFLTKIKFRDEINCRWKDYASLPEFCILNGSFEGGDADYWYSVIRYFRPKRIIEIGSGYSTLIARQAIERNNFDDEMYHCEHICVEPYEQSWLEGLGVKVLRVCVESVPLDFFDTLNENDILFIDSSHIIRPQGDVLYEFLELLPRLRKGVVVHIHDIFTPKNYSHSAIIKDVLFWNEQYLLEAFLTNNSDWKILGAVNYLKHNYFEKLRVVCPYLRQDNEPGSFYIRKIN